ncbi:MAG: type II toxin-antitoxin system RelE/ParE family toxin [Candidatus Paceibacterota bacterium]|jgi:phage-related protein
MVQIRVNYISDSILEYIKALDDRTCTGCFKAICDLKNYGSELTMPISKNIGNGLFELRINESLSIRIIYTFCDGNAWIIHAFKKTSKKISKKDINTALKRKKLLFA